MKVILSEALQPHLPSLKVHVLLVRGVKLEVLRFFHAQPPMLDPDRVEAVIVAWRDLYRRWPEAEETQSAIVGLLHCVMSQRWQSDLPLVEMQRYAALLALAPISGYALPPLGDSLTLAYRHTDRRAGNDRTSDPPLWRDDRQRTVCPLLGAGPQDANRLNADTCDMIFVGEQPDERFPSPECGMRYLQATLAPLCGSLQSGVLSFEPSRRQWDVP
jgi:hypothetical protein